MKRMLILLFAASSLTAVGQVPDYVPTEGLVAWYPLNGNAEDAYAGQLDGVPSNPQPSVNRNLEDSSAFFFDGLDDRVTLSNFQETTFGLTHFSVNAWVLLNEAKRHWIFSNYKTGNGNTIVLGLGAEVANGQAVLHVDLRHPNGAPEFFGSQVIELQEWHMVSLVRNGWNLSLFLDGELDAVADISMESNNLRNGHPFHFGMENGSGQFWHGSLDDIGLWDRALSPNEIGNLYAEWSPVFGCMEVEACNYDPEAMFDDGSCLDCALFAERCGPGTLWDSETQMCIGDGSGDINLDGCVQLNDLLDLLSAYGDCGAEEAPWACGDPLQYQGYDYETVQIGEQCWFAENLRAENYRNGDLIPALLSDDEWATTNQGAVSVYGEDAGCDSSAPDLNPCDADQALQAYGRLYNLHAVLDERRLCPNGWHSSSDADWMALEIELGMSESQVNSTGWRGADEGGQLKSQIGWAFNGNGSNSSGFSALPGGTRYPTPASGVEIGDFMHAGDDGYWWTSTTEETGISGWGRLLYDYFNTVARATWMPNHGMSVRCLKDAE